MKRLSALIFLLAPPALLLGWYILKNRTGTGPEMGWFTSHAILLGAYALLIIAIVSLRQLLGAQRGGMAVLANGGLIIGLLGLCAFVAQMAVDIVVGLLAVDKAGMSQLFRQINGNLLLNLMLYSVGPALFYVGLILIMIALWRRQHIHWISALLVIVGALVTGAGKGLETMVPFLYPIGLILVWIGLWEATYTLWSAKRRVE